MKKERLTYKRYSQELTPVPSSIAHPDGSLNKSVKSQLLHKLECVQKVVDSIPPSNENVAYVLDGMKILYTTQMLKTFGLLANVHYEKAEEYLRMGTVQRVDVVFDIYSDEMKSI